MIKATRELLVHLKQGKSIQDLYMISALVNVIEIYGGVDDGEAIGEYLLENQGNVCFGPIYDVVLKWGNRSLAKRFFVKAIAQDQLLDGFDLEVLEVFGKFQLEEARPVLVEYALKNNDYYSNLSAVRGLLHYNCDDLQGQIRSAIESVYNKSLFAELLPALVSKLQDRAEVLEKLFISGSEYASTDCNAGIILGFSLCGEEGLPYFKKAVFDPFWEAHYNARHYVVEGMRNLGITFSALFQEIQRMEDLKEQEYGLILLLSLLETKILSGKTEPEAVESFYDIKVEFFSLKNGKYSGDFVELAEKFNWTEEAYKLMHMLDLRVREEAVFRAFQA